MKANATLAVLAAVAVTAANASWYWPFGSDDDEKEKPRLSEIMEPASLLIDSASDLADDGKIREAVAEYRKALAELDRIELENPDRAETDEFATVRNKRAYVNAAIDALLLNEARTSAKAVAVTDTTALERKYASEKAARAAGDRAAAEARSGSQGASGVRTDPAAAAARRANLAKAVELFKNGDYDAADARLAAILAANPSDCGAMNLRAAVLAERGDAVAAERVLLQLIRANPRSYHGYYNLARLILKTRGEEGKAAAARYYESGRDICGGPVDPDIEERLR
jgi:TolA-binding protein